MAEKIPILAVVGPTASGKTRLSVELAKQLHGEIVNADSMQVYQEMNIATAKPSMAERQGVPHHLLDFLPLSSTFSVAQYVELAHACVREIAAKGYLPILVGGTGLYVNSLIDNIQFSGQGEDPALRARLEQRIREEGANVLLQELEAVDPQTAHTLHPNNTKRIVRALELYYTTGITMSEQRRLSRSVESPYRVCMLGLDFQNRETLYQRINQRVDQMLQDGLVEEAESVLHSPYSKTAMGAIGYKELAEYFRGECSLEQAVETLKRETRRYAKRQLTWFRRDQRIHWIFVDACKDFEEVLEKSLNFVALQSDLCYSK